MPRTPLAILSGVAAAALATAAAAHPLDGLTPEEITAVGEILAEAGHTTEDSRWPLIELYEPPKDFVLNWQEGDPEQRQAIVNVNTAEGTFKGIVDLTERTVVSWEPAEGEPMILVEEFVQAMELALSHPDFVAGLEERGFTPDDVFCLPLTAGAFGDPDEAGRRLMKVPCYVLPEGSNWYAKPIEGLYATVDLRGEEVVEVIDTGVVPVPEDSWGYTTEEIAARPDMELREETERAGLEPPAERNVSVYGSLVTWDMWSFRWRIDKRPGVVLSDIRADGREVLYQAHLSEVFVPYMDPSEGWYWRTYMDSGEYGFGIFLSPLRPGVDCPTYATYLPALVHADDGTPLEIPGAVCIFERQIGDPAWRHFEIFAQGPDTFTPAEGRPATELIVRSASEVGNYDYLIDYRFDQSGRMNVMVGSTGLDALKGVAATSMADDTAVEDTQHGTLIAPNLVAPNHDHFFNFRLDFDIDGRSNSFMRTGIVPATAPEDVPRRTMWVTEQEMPQTEGEARYKVNPDTPAMYHVGNMGVTSGLGHHPSYMIQPGNSVAYSPLDVTMDPPAMRNPYIEYTMYVTPYDRDQRYAGGEYAFQSDGSDTLATWMQQDRPIADTDIVTWYTMGFHHIPRMEDWPVMPLMWKGITLAPFNFFDHNPAITIPLSAE
ncbi:tyramine oxidase [Psychromarinibacter sp. C21-152]|uniref:Amine oxidase n=1 Tax=Psychromarinibacter sediminicola TaxID=3033385 RepID=A0AAE3NS86_9RHOB|nr:tyramine oxidase [Psychromarinibacter sediminicola]MDF0601066.1 tyramine oxidase [Psychromarinibacter sediminicola]